MQLSLQQKDAVEYIGTPTLVVAGAGSGKTRTLTAKIAHLISSGYEPERILAITFTNKAAGEMKSRLVRMTKIQAKRFPWVRTFHSACFEILKKHCSLLGYDIYLGASKKMDDFSRYAANTLECFCDCEYSSGMPGLTLATWQALEFYND